MIKAPRFTQAGLLGFSLSQAVPPLGAAGSGHGQQGLSSVPRSLAPCALSVFPRLQRDPGLLTGRQPRGPSEVRAERALGMGKRHPAEPEGWPGLRDLGP